MKITKVTPIFCDGGWRAFTFIKVETDEGLVGYGECTDNRSSFGIGGCVRDLEPRLIGQNPTIVEKRYWDMCQHFQQNPGGIAQKAIAGIEVALWDIKAKALNVPLYELFGGPLWDKIRVYWSHCGTYRARSPELFTTNPPLRTMDDIAKLGEEVVARGYTALKTNIVIPGERPRMLRTFDQNIDYNILKAIDRLMSTFRKAVGDAVDICLDLNFNFKTEGFIQVAKVVEPYNLMWLELDIYDPDALLQIKQSTRVPICSAENLYTMKGYQPYLERHAMDVCMIDLPWNGYIESRRIAALADMYETMVAPHNYYSHLSTFMSAHLCASVPNVKIMETDVDSVPWRDDIITELPDIRDGYLSLTKKPGIGAELNEKEIAKHPWPK
ncbi:MAG TPA: mandelate racemase/muconate lactonizing enzyme family protein [Dehalococcoidales bacterium]|nr:mandelate racemase/muconate lactonizing enzyme family protein [Dehalococcoidales bacterium]